MSCTFIWVYPRSKFVLRLMSNLLCCGFHSSKLKPTLHWFILLIGHWTDKLVVAPWWQPKNARRWNTTHTVVGLSSIRALYPSFYLHWLGKTKNCQFAVVEVSGAAVVETILYCKRYTTQPSKLCYLELYSFVGDQYQYNIVLLRPLHRWYLLEVRSMISVQIDSLQPHTNISLHKL